MVYSYDQLSLEALITGVGCNGQPDPNKCDASEHCRKNCNKLCVHAEMRALRSLSVSSDLKSSYLVHVKVTSSKDDETNGYIRTLMNSGPPSCWQCSREILDMKLGGVWLYHGPDTTDFRLTVGWELYPADEFHRLTLINCDLNINGTQS